MSELKETFEKTVRNLYAIDWSETDGSDIKNVFEFYFDNIPNNKIQIQNLIENSARFNKFQKDLIVTILDAC